MFDVVFGLILHLGLSQMLLVSEGQGVLLFHAGEYP